jgi:hypothetical protein
MRVFLIAAFAITLLMAHEDSFHAGDLSGGGF